MDGRAFERDLKNMEREVLALKQAHKFGLGVFQFYKKTLSYTAPAIPSSAFPLRYFYVAVTVAEGEYTPPFIQLSSRPTLMSPEKVVVSNNGRTVTYTFFDNYPLVDTTYNIIAISASQITSMEVTSGDEA